MRRSIEEEIEKFLELWDCKQIISFLHDLIPLMVLYDVDEEDDWLKDIVGQEDLQNVRLIRTVYLLSKIAENHSGKICSIKIHFKDIYKRLEDIANGDRNI